VTVDLDLRLVRHFVAVAEELHFGRAAARLYVAQQSLSRDVARLERHLGAPLLIRSTRHVALTPEGERFLVRARQLLAVQDQAVLEVRAADRPLVVDVVRDGTTAARILARARTSVPDRTLEGRFHGGVGAALTALLAHRVDVAFGRIGAAQRAATDHLARRLVRLEPLGLILPDDHPLAGGDAVPLAALAGLTVDTSAGNTAAPEWVELATELVEQHGAVPSPPHHPGMAAVAAAGPAETVHHLRDTGWPILTLLDVPPLPGATVRPLADPVPVYPWLVVHRPDLHHPGLDALDRAVDALAGAEDWRRPPAGAWFAAGDRDFLRVLSGEAVARATASPDTTR
jgi:DNA-binding transcriptional LysR family regulator